MKLFGFQPKGHGQYSFFVAAETLDQAKAAIQADIDRRVAMPISDADRFTKWDYSGWDTEDYDITIAEPGQVLINSND